MTKRDFEKHDGVGLALFAAGVFCAALVVPAMFSGPSAVAVPAGTSAGVVPWIAATWVGAIGAWPSFAFTAPVAVFGARLFLRGPIAGLLRHIVGTAFVAASLAILLGAFSATAGGTFGARIGGGITGATHIAFGALIGVLALAATVWFVWLKHDTLVDEEPVNVRNPELEADDDASDDGVSREEAEALLPKELPRVAPAAQRAPVFAPPPSPYPEDVRKRGEIPAGARPIATAGSAASSPPSSSLGAPSTAYRWTAPGARTAEAPVVAQPSARETETGERSPLADATREVPAGAQALAGGAALEGSATRIANVPSASWENADENEDIAVDAYGTPLTLVESLRKESARAAAPLADADEFDEPEFDDEVESDDFETDDDEIVASAQRADDESDDEAFAEDDDTLVDETVTASAQPPHVVEAELFAAVEAEADRQFAQRTRAVAEPGTPAPVVYAVRAELGAVAQDEDRELEPSETLVEQLELVSSAPLAVVQETAAVVEIETEAVASDEPEAAGDEEIDEVDDEEELEDAESELAADELDAEAEFIEEALAADEVDARAEAASADGDGEDDELADDETDETSDTDAPEATPARAERGEPLPVAGKLADARTRGQELLDFDLRTAAAAAVPASSVFVAGTPERDVVLTPPAVAAERSIKAPAGKPDGDRAALLAEVGCLFIDRKRVAVSMLQRQYQMDFDDACRVLDELQSMGLIGPYLGGQSRDILLTREEWLEKVGAS